MGGTGRDSIRSVDRDEPSYHYPQCRQKVLRLNSEMSQPCFNAVFQERIARTTILSRQDSL